MQAIGSISEAQPVTGSNGGASTAEIVSSPSSDAVPFLACHFRTGNNTTSTAGTTPDTVLAQEEGKKSSFLLQPTKDGSTHSIPSPSHIVIEYNPESHEHEHHDSSPFFLGGMQLVSSARDVVVYLTGQNGEESYLMTSKGIKFRGENPTVVSNNSNTNSSSLTKEREWFKAICVIPGGPRPILRLRINLLNVRPKGAQSAELFSMKLTARLAEPPSPRSLAAVASPVTPTTPAVTAAATTTASASPVVSGNSTQGTNDNNNGSSPSKSQKVPPLQSPPKRMEPPESPSRSNHSMADPVVTQSDLSAAMAGFSFMSRNMEKSICERLEKHTESCFVRMEKQMHTLQSIVLSQQKQLEETQNAVKQQQMLMQAQAEQLRDLRTLQEDLRVRVQSVQADMSILRCHQEDPVGTYDVDESVIAGGGGGTDERVVDIVPITNKNDENDDAPGENKDDELGKILHELEKESTPTRGNKNEVTAMSSDEREEDDGDDDDETATAMASVMTESVFLNAFDVKPDPPLPSDPVIREPTPVIEMGRDPSQRVNRFVPFSPEDLHHEAEVPPPPGAAGVDNAEDVEEALASEISVALESPNESEDEDEGDANNHPNIEVTLWEDDLASRKTAGSTDDIADIDDGNDGNEEEAEDEQLDIASTVAEDTTLIAGNLKSARNSEDDEDGQKPIDFGYLNDTTDQPKSPMSSFDQGFIQEKKEEENVRTLEAIPDHGKEEASGDMVVAPSPVETQLTSNVEVGSFLFPSQFSCSPTNDKIL